MPSRDEGGDLGGFSGGGAGGATEVSCSWEEDSAQHLKRAALCAKMDNTKMNSTTELSNQTGRRKGVKLGGRRGGAMGLYLDVRGSRGRSGDGEASWGWEEGDGEGCRDGRHGQK